MKNKNLFNLAFATIFIIFSVLMVLLIDDKNNYFWTSYIFTVIAIAGVYASGIFFSKGQLKNFPADFSLVPIAVRYLVSEFLIFIFLDPILEIDFKWYISIQIIAFAIALISAMFMLMGRNHINNISNNTQVAVSELKLIAINVEQMIAKANELNKTIRKEAISILADLDEKLRYSDPVIHDRLKDLDEDIKINIYSLNTEMEHLIEIDSDTIESLKSSVDKIIKMLAERNAKAKILK